MSLYDYSASRAIAGHDLPFYALIMAAMRQADSNNAEKLQAAWPEIWSELRARYNAPGGVLASDGAAPEPATRIDYGGGVLDPQLRDQLDGGAAHTPVSVTRPDDWRQRPITGPLDMALREEMEKREGGK